MDSCYESTIDLETVHSSEMDRKDVQLELNISFQIFLNISKIFESILLSFLFSPYILEQFLRTSQNSICIMKDFPQRENPLEVFNRMNWVKINCIKKTK